MLLKILKKLLSDRLLWGTHPASSNVSCCHSGLRLPAAAPFWWLLRLPWLLGECQLPRHPSCRVVWEHRTQTTHSQRSEVTALWKLPKTKKNTKKHLNRINMIKPPEYHVFPHSSLQVVKRRSLPGPTTWEWLKHKWRPKNYLPALGG